MPALKQFEYDLNLILRCVLGDLPVAQIHSQLVRSIPKPPCLSRACVELVKSTLASGMTKFLSAEGSSQRRFLNANRNEEIASGRVWERHESDSLGLEFSRNTLDLLIWLTSEEIVRTRAKPRFSRRIATLGDSVFEWMLIERIHEEFKPTPLLDLHQFQVNPLVRLMLPGALFVQRNVSHATTDLPAADFGPWLQPSATWLLEVLQDQMFQSVLRVERFKRNLSEAKKIQELGEIQADAMNRLIDAADLAGRHDLCRFILRSGHYLLRGGRKSPVARIDVTGLTMADRARTYAADLSLFHCFQRLHAWHESMRGVSFYDENYQASQLWKSSWDDHNGDFVQQRSSALIQECRPI